MIAFTAYEFALSLKQGDFASTGAPLFAFLLLARVYTNTVREYAWHSGDWNDTEADDYAWYEEDHPNDDDRPTGSPEALHTKDGTRA